MHEPDRLPPRLRLPVAAVLLLLVTLYGLAALETYSAVIDGRRVFWLQDDMMISMRYARNLAREGTLVWNPGGDRVEGYSNLGWVLVMALVHLLPLPATHTSAVMLGLSIAAAGWLVLLTVRLSRRLLPGATLAPLLAVVTLAATSDVARFTLMALETIPIACLLTWLLLRVLREAEEGGGRPSTYLAAGVLGVLRVDGVFLTGLALLPLFLLGRDRRRELTMLPLALLLPAAVVVFRLLYHGHLLPNTYYLKVTGWSLSDRLAAGAAYSMRFLLQYGLLWLVAAWGVVTSRSRKAQVLWLLGLPIVLYGFAVGGDSFHGLRFLTPWLPVLMALAFLAPGLAGWPERSFRHVGLLAALSVSVVVFAGYRFGGQSPEAPFVRAGLFLDRVTSPSTRMAHTLAGTVPYFADRPGVDLLGKCDARIAHLAVRAGLRKPGHNKFDFAYSLGELKPDLVVASMYPGYLSQPGVIETLAATDDAYLTRLYLDPVFQARYAPRVAFVANVPVFIAPDYPGTARLMTGRCTRVGAEPLVAVGMRDACWPDVPPS
jgi:hypothetical protein